MGAYAFGLLNIHDAAMACYRRHHEGHTEHLPTLAMYAGRDVLTIVVPFGLVLMALGVGAQLLQAGLVLSSEKFKWDLHAIKPACRI